MKIITVNLTNKHSIVQFKWSVDPLLSNLTYRVDKIYHRNGVAYDYYSQNDLGQSRAGHQWDVWPLPNITTQGLFAARMEISPARTSKIPFVDAIYITSVPYLTERHANLKKALHQQGITTESLNWKMKWNYTTCNSDANRSYVCKRLNLRNQFLSERERRRCSLLMNHMDAWNEIAERKIPLALILEDDAIFVPFLKEKLARLISKAIDTKALRLNEECIKPRKTPMSTNEWTHQDPMIVIGKCEHNRDTVASRSPSLSTHKRQASRCAHAYLLTSCSAQALFNQILAQKNLFHEADAWQDYLFRLSPVLQAFWVDPTLAYQGNRAIDFDNLTTFKRTTWSS